MSAVHRWRLDLHRARQHARYMVPPRPRVLVGPVALLSARLATRGRATLTSAGFPDPRAAAA
eukprot:7497484-Lingulodinium_polyedra.AAC.1